MLDAIIDWLKANYHWIAMGIIIHLTILGTVAYLILLERKIASWVQDRIGPNRVGLGFGILPVLKNFHFWGLGQPLADGLKFLVKEDYRPKHVDRILFSVAPMVMIAVVIISIATLPWGGYKGRVDTFDVTAAAIANTGQPEKATAAEFALIREQLPPAHQIVGTPVFREELRDGKPTVLATVSHGWAFQIANLNIGVLYILAVLSLAVYGVVLGGWASNNKFSFLGGLRATANMISYEIPLGLAVLSIVVMYGSLNLAELVEAQAHSWWDVSVGGHTFGVVPAWNVFCQPLAFLMFLVCIFAEANRAPFDTAEAEQELVGGYHTEYSSMRFALFFLAEYAGMITTSAVCVALFFGGWDFPGLRGHLDLASPSLTDSIWIALVRAVVFYAKTLVVIAIFMWVRWSLPRFRFDQIMTLAWRALIPISLLQLMATAVLVYVWGGHGREHMRINGWFGLTLLGMNVAIAIVTMIASTVVPPAPATNRRMVVKGSRFNKTPVAATTG
jgi:NADH-quinone oxidoreductase subunit H